ncbi:MAG: hypothetical protein PHE25_03615 [Candidatus Gracilibacteria bacterium]|nr:hypothetical protein [Candidatus Gracilibacteria bacterium]
MRKILIVLIFILLSCSTNGIIQKESAFKNENISLENSNSGEFGETGNKNIQISQNNFGNKSKDNEKIDSNIIKLYSPIYTLSGDTFSGTTKIEVIFSGSTIMDNYFLKQYKIGTKEFVTNLRLDYKNIENGENNYEIKFYNKDNKLLGVKNYKIKVNYNEVKVGKNIIFIDKSQLSDNFLELKSVTSELCRNYREKDFSIKNFYKKNVLLFNGNNYEAIQDCFTFSQVNNNILFYKISKIDKDMSLCPEDIPAPCQYYYNLLFDIYYNGKKIKEGFDLIYDGGEYTFITNPYFIKEKNILYYQQSYGSTNSFVNTYFLDDLNNNRVKESIILNGEGDLLKLSFSKNIDTNKFKIIGLIGCYDRESQLGEQCKEKEFTFQRLTDYDYILNEKFFESEWRDNFHFNVTLDNGTKESGEYYILFDN